MSARFCAPVLLIALSLGSAAVPVYADEAGRALAQKVYDRPDGNDAVSSGTMILREKGGAPRSRSLHSYVREVGAAQTLSLVRFSAPDEIAGTGLLTRDNPGADADQWVYLPELKKSRRIPGNRKGGNFVGSDLFYEDLQDRKIDADTHTLLGKEKIQNADCDILQSIPVKADNSVYSKRISWIHPQTLVPLRVDYYQGKATPVKRLEVLKIEKKQGFWTVMQSRMTHLETGHSTEISLQSIHYDKGLPDTLFTEQTLTDPARDAQFR